MSLDIFQYSDHLLIAYITYFLGAASPGPSNLLIMSVALEKGRKTALALACGVLTGSYTLCWLSAFGLQILLTQYPLVYSVFVIFGGAYLCFLGFLMLIRLRKPLNKQKTVPDFKTLSKNYFMGFSLHLLNMKAISVWISIFALGVPTGAPPYLVWVVAIGCNILGFIVVLGQAVLFSNAYIQQRYLGIRKFMGAFAFIIFNAAGISILVISIPEMLL